jgi:putative transposase
LQLPFLPPDTQTTAQWRTAAHQLSAKAPKLATLMDAAEADDVGAFPNEAAFIRVVGPILLEQSDEWVMRRVRHMTLENIGAVRNNLNVCPSSVIA